MSNSTIIHNYYHCVLQNSIFTVFLTCDPKKWSKYFNILLQSKEIVTKINDIVIHSDSYVV